MATADQVKALIRSHADGDDTRFYAIAVQVAAQAARSGHGKFAQELRELVDQVKARFRLDQNGIEFVGARVRAKHLPAATTTTNTQTRPPRRRKKKGRA